MKTVWWLMVWFVVFWVRFENGFQANKNLSSLADSEVRLVGNISSQPILQGSSQSFKMGRVKVYAKRFPELKYGDKVAVFGTLEERVVNRWFSYFSLVYPDVQTIKTDSETSRILRLRERFEAVIDQNLPEPEASLLAGIVLGVKRGLPKGFWQALQKTGTLHIVVASGYNVTVVIGTVISYLAAIVKRKQAVILGIGAVVVYTIMAGAGPAIVRAAIMGSLAYFGQVLGRKADGVRLLITAAGVMLWWEPYLIWDVGFQLSLMATVGLIYVSPILGQGLNKIWLVGRDMSETVGAQIGVWPILIITFGQLSAFAVVVNSLILWLVPIIMGLGVLLGLSGLVWAPLGKVMGVIVYGPLTLMVRVIEWFGGFEWMSWTVEKINWWWGMGYYFLVVVFLVYFSKRKVG